MREIKFRAWHREKKCWLDSIRIYNDGSWAGSIVEERGEIDGYDERECELMQYTGLKDKNGLTYVYEDDIIGVDGIVRGNKYENENLLQDSTNLVIEGFGTRTWWATYKEAMARGCQNPK